MKMKFYLDTFDAYMENAEDETPKHKRFIMCGTDKDKAVSNALSLMTLSHGGSTMLMVEAQGHYGTLSQDYGDVVGCVVKHHGQDAFYEGDLAELGDNECFV